MSATAGRMGVWLAVLLAVLVSGCRVCTLMLCRNAITFGLSDAAALFPAGQPVEVRACLDESCVTETLTVESGSSGASAGDTPLVALDLPTRSLYVDSWAVSESPHTVSLELKRAGSVVLSETRADVQVTGEETNGPGCGFCYSVVVEL